MTRPDSAPRRLRLRLIVGLTVLACVAGLTAATPAYAAAGFAAQASVQSDPQYINDPAGADLTFTVHNSGTKTSIGAVEIASPGIHEVITACPAAPSGWTAQVRPTRCRYISAATPGDDLAPGATSSQFQVQAKNTGSVSDYIGTWDVTVSKSTDLDTPSQIVAAFATGTGLRPPAYTWEVTDAVVAAAALPPGSACPAPNKSAAAGSTGNVVVICGWNHSTRQETPQSSLAGTFIASPGTFTTARIKPSTANVVIGNWKNVTVSSAVGTGQTVIAQVNGQYVHQTSPTVTLNGYAATGNQPPVAGDDSYSTGEDGQLTVAAPGVLANDTASHPLTAVLDTDTTHGLLSLSGDGSFTYQPAANYNGSDSFTYHADDGTVSSSIATVSITVKAVNDPPSFDLPASPNQTVPQGAGVQTVTGFATNISAGPADESSQALTFHVTDDNNALFSVQPSIDPATGNLTYTPAPSASGAATVSVFLADDGGTANGGDDTSATQTFQISLSTVNQAPSFSLPASPNQTVLEDAGAQSVTGFATNISAGPSDESAQALTFHVSNDNNALFAAQPSVDPTTGTLSYTSAPNTNGSATVSVFLTDNGGTADGGQDTSATQTFTITVTAVNDVPVFTLPASPNQSVSEDAGAQTVTGFATGILAGPPDESGQALTFHVSNDNNALFSAQPSIDVATGTLTYTPAAGVSGSTTVAVSLSDNGGTANGGHNSTGNKTFTITVLAVNHAPSFSVPASPNQSVLEDAGAQTVPGFATSISAGSPSESGQTLTFHVSSDNSALFSVQPAIDPATGGLTYTPAPNANGSATVSAFLTDNGGTANGGSDTSATQTFTIGVIGVNDPPTFALTASPDQTVLEDAGAKTVVGLATGISAGPANESAQTLTLHVSNDNAALFSVQPAIDVTTGSLTYTSAPNANGSATVSVFLTDSGGTANGGGDTSATQTFHITVTAVNDAPSFSLPASPNQAVLANAGAQTVPAFATNILAGPPNESGQVLTFHVSNSANTLFSAQPAINVATGTLTYTPIAGQIGSATVTVSLSDDGGVANGGHDSTANKTFTIAVNSSNSAPTDIAISASSIPENSGANAAVGTFSTTDSDVGDNHTYTLVTGTGATDNASFTITAAGVLQEVASFNFEAKTSYSIRVRSTDAGGLFFEKAFTITVTNVNEAPTDVTISNSSIPENSGANAAVGILSTTDPDVGDTHTYTLVTGTGSTDNASFTVTAAGGLQEVASFNFDTKSSYSIRVRSTDAGGLFVEKAFTITVTNVNDAPTDIAISNSSIPENSGANAAVGILSTTDPDVGDTHTYALVTGTGSTDNASFTVTAAGGLQEVASLNFEAKSSYSIRVRSTDAGGLFVEKAFTITVTNVNESPTDIAISASSIPENSGANAPIGTFSTTDPDVGDTHAYTLVTGTGSTDNASFTVTAAGGLQEVASLNFEAKSSYSIRVRSTDAGGLFVEKAFTITVTNVNEAPTDIALSKASIAENSGANAAVGTLSSTDPDVGDTHTYTLVTGTGSTDNTSFTITAAGGLQEVASLNFEAKSSYSIRVRSTDGGSLFFEKAFTITITDVDDAPVAVADSYTGAVGNTLAVVGTTGTGPSVTLAGSNLIANDTDEDTGAFAHALSAVAETVTSTGGGTATISSNGSFTFLPGVGAENQSDTFTYHVTDGTLTSAGTVTIHIDNVRVWYVDNSSVTSTHDGRSSTPFTNLSSLNAAGGTGDVDGPGDLVFLYRGNSGTTPYAGGIPLEANQSLLGQSNGLVADGHTLVAAGASPAVITNAAGVGVGLANGVDIEGISITGTSGDGIAGVGVSLVGVGVNAPVAVTNSGGDGVHLSGAASGSDTIVANVSGSAQHSVDISGRTSGTVQFGGTISDSGTGISVTGNTGATINFS